MAYSLNEIPKYGLERRKDQSRPKPRNLSDLTGEKNQKLQAREPAPGLNLEPTEYGMRQSVLSHHSSISTDQDRNTQHNVIPPTKACEIRNSIFNPLSEKANIECQTNFENL
jgi:hypothetical protein